MRDVWDGVRALYPQVDGFGKSLIFSVNQEFADFDAPVKEDDEVAIFPPVSGGGLTQKKAYLENEDGDVFQEAMRVAEHYGETITMSVDERIRLAHTIGNSKISMHQDIERGRPMEIDAIVSSVLELARKAAIDTPMIVAVHALISERARHA